MDRGYIKLWRRSLDSQIWQNPELWHLWCWCLLKATHKPIWVNVRTGRGFTEVYLERGQFIFGRNQAAKELRQKPSSIYKRLLKLKNLQNLNIQDNNQFSIITICNYDLYQPCEEGEVTTKVTTKEQPSSTNNNIENIKTKKIFVEDKSSTPNGEKKGKTFSEEKIEYQLSDYLFQRILKLNPEHKRPNLQTWAGHIDLMLRVDGRKQGQVKAVIDWIFGGESKDALFWQKNILSTQKLRDQYDRLVIQMGEVSGQGGDNDGWS